MKLYKLGLLALTLSLVATVIILDNKRNAECDFDCADDSDENVQEESSNNIVVEEATI